MIIMDLKVDNLLAFHDFHINMTYPKKIVDSYIPEENLKGFNNFRYKKINILLGTNSTGKTSLGIVFMSIFNFIKKKEINAILPLINDNKKAATFTIDFIPDGTSVLYRLDCKISPCDDENYNENHINLQIKKVNINKRDSYETCVKKFERMSDSQGNYLEKLSNIQNFGWMFKYPFDSEKKHKYCTSNDSELYEKVLENILKSLDISIIKVEKSKEVENAYLIYKKDKTIVMQDGEIVHADLLSSGTKAGIDIAHIVTSILEGANGFYYCDEKFSYIQSDIEKSILSLMIANICSNEQLFFTTHNLDVLDLPLPKHSFHFLKKEMNGLDTQISCICASDYLKKNTDSLKNAVENDLFSVSPKLDLIYELDNLVCKED